MISETYSVVDLMRMLLVMRIALLVMPLAVKLVMSVVSGMIAAFVMSSALVRVRRGARRSPSTAATGMCLREVPLSVECEHKSCFNWMN